MDIVNLVLFSTRKRRCKYDIIKPMAEQALQRPLVGLVDQTITLGVVKDGHALTLQRPLVGLVDQTVSFPLTKDPF